MVIHKEHKLWLLVCTLYKWIYKMTSYQDRDALFFTEHRCSTQQEANQNPLERKSVISVTP